MKTRIMLTIAALFSIALTLGCSAEAAKEKTAKPVKATAVQKHSGTSSVRYSASIRPAAQLDASFKVSGYIDNIGRVKDHNGQWRYLQAGDVVSKGTVLARIRQSDYVARVNEAKSQGGEARSAIASYSAQLKEATAAVQTSEAQVEEAKANFERARLDFNRAQALLETQSITKPEYDAARATYEMAEAKFGASKGQLQVAQAKVAIAKSQISVGESRLKTAEAATASVSIPLLDTELRAPMSAVVIERKIEVGTLVSQGTPGFILADVSLVKVAFGVPDIALQTLKLGDTLSVTTDAVPGTEFSGHISRISPSADQNSRVFDVEVTIANPNGQLKPGMIASVSVSREQAKIEMPAIPLTAVTRAKDKPDGYAVFVVEERGGESVARLRNVELGESFGNSVAIVSGLQPGEVVITSGATQVADGENVKLIP